MGRDTLLHGTTFQQWLSTLACRRLRRFSRHDHAKSATIIGPNTNPSQLGSQSVHATMIMPPPAATPRQIQTTRHRSRHEPFTTQALMCLPPPQPSLARSRGRAVPRRPRWPPNRRTPADESLPPWPARTAPMRSQSSFASFCSDLQVDFELPCDCGRESNRLHRRSQPRYCG